VGIPGTTVLTADEIVTEIQIPTPASGVKSAFIKNALRASIDFPVVNCAAMIGGGDARICLNAVYNLPYRATKAEDSIKGQTIDDSSADTAAAAGVQGAIALANNKWKIQVAKALIKRTILACK
jgi:xanthine dehydrogenase YagS FAD-binding subunit